MAAYILFAEQRGHLTFERQLLQRLGHVNEQIDRLDLGGQQVHAVCGRVVLHDNLALRWVDDQLALDWQVAHDVSPDSRAAANPSHVDSHVTEQFHVQAATINTSA